MPGGETGPAEIRVTAEPHAKGVFYQTSGFRQVGVPRNDDLCLS